MDMKKRKRREGEGEKARSLASLLCASHHTHFLMVVCHAFRCRSGQKETQEREKEQKVFVYFSWLEAAADEVVCKHTENPLGDCITKEFNWEIRLERGEKSAPGSKTKIFRRPSVNLCTKGDGS